MRALFATTMLGLALLTTGTVAQNRAPTCRPIAQRTAELGCWIITDQPVGRLPRGEAFWHLDIFRSRTESEGAKGQYGTVLESFGKVWLLSIEDEPWRA